MLKTWQVIEKKRQKLANVDWHENDHSKWMSYKLEGKLSEQKFVIRKNKLIHVVHKAVLTKCLH